MSTTSSISGSTGAWTQDQLNALVTVATASAQSGVDKLTLDRTRLDAEDSDISSIRSSLEDLQDKLETLTDNGSMTPKKSEVTEEDVMDVDADGDAVTGNYEVEVTALAQRNQLASSSFADSASGLSSAEGAGAKTFTIKCGGTTETFSLDVSSGQTNSDLMKVIADKINSNSSVCSAGIIKEGTDSSTLILTAKDYGTAGALTLADASGTLLKSCGVIDGAGAAARQLQAGSDAALKIGDKLTITRSSNQITDAVNGVTLSLKTLGKTTVTVSADTDTTIKNFNEFLSAYNAAQTRIGTEVNEAPDSPGDGETESDVDVTVGTLYGNSQMSAIRNAMRRIMSGTQNLAVRNLAELGITLQSASAKSDDPGKACNLKLDSAALKEALRKNPDAVQQLLTGPNGILTQLGTELTSDLKHSGGAISNLSDATSQRLEAITRRMTSAQKLLDQQTTYYNNLYNSFASQITGMQASSQTLNAVLASLGSTSST